MNVQETVFGMMRAYPTMYRSRVMALARLFDSYDSEWVNGELIDNEHRSGRDFLPYPPEKLVETGDLREIHDVLFARRQNAKAQFVYDNAELMSKHSFSSFGKHSTIRFSGRHFDDIPADITPEWLEAAKELAQAVVSHKYYPDTTYAADHALHQAKEEAASVAICNQFLERFRVKAIDPIVSAARLSVLTREARALGYALVQESLEPNR